MVGSKIRGHYGNTMGGMDEALRQSIEEHADAVIGGRHCCQIAGTFGIPAYFASGGTEGLSETLMMAPQIADQIDTERRDAAELNAMFENNFNGILQAYPGADPGAEGDAARGYERDSLGHDPVPECQLCRQYYACRGGEQGNRCDPDLPGRTQDPSAGSGTAQRADPQRTYRQ